MNNTLTETVLHTHTRANMKFLTFAVLALAAVARAEVQDEGKSVVGKRGTVGYTASTQSPTYATASPAPQTYSSKLIQQSQALLQAQPQKTVTYQAAPQAQYYQQPAVRYVSQPAYSAAPQQQYQYQPQQVAYEPQAAITKVPTKVPIQYSLAGDVSSFSYASPVVQYNNLGLLTQITPKAAHAVAYQPQAAQVQYTQQAAPVQYTQQAAPVQYTQQANAVAKVAYPQAQATQVAYQAAPKVAYASQPQVAYATAPQTYSAVPQYSHYAQPSVAYAQAPQGYQGAQSIPQSVYVAAPQYYQVASKLTPGITYA